MNRNAINRDIIISILEEVPDPEIPVLNIIDLGIVRNIEISGSQSERNSFVVSGLMSEKNGGEKNDKQQTTNNISRLIITITPTYTGCPAMQVIEEDILSALKKNGFNNVEIKTILSPAWTTDWMNESAREKLRAYGIAPPEKVSADKNILFGKSKQVICPQCGSSDTEMKSQFGSTACKSLYVCSDCKEPFDYFKCI